MEQLETKENRVMSVETSCEYPVSQSVEAYFLDVLPILKAFSALLLSHGLKEYTYLGSCALLAAGFPLGREPHDIDVEVLCEEKADALFANLKEIGRADGKHDDGYDWEQRGYRAFIKFRFARRTFNVWTRSPEKEFSDNRRFMSEGLWFSGVSEVLEAKALYGRDKDRIDTYNIINTLAGLFGLYTHSDDSGTFIGNPSLKDGEEENNTDNLISYLDAELKIQLCIPFKHGKDDGYDTVEDKAHNALYEVLDQCGDWELLDTLEFEICVDK